MATITVIDGVPVHDPIHGFEQRAFTVWALQGILLHPYRLPATPRPAWHPPSIAVYRRPPGRRLVCVVAP